MGGAWIIGPLIIQKHWVIYIVSIFVGYLVLRFFVNNKQVGEILWNGFFVFLVVWKVSYVFFNPVNVIQHPLSLLYFHGGSKGVILGLVGAVFYLVWKSKRGFLSFSQMMESGLVVVLSALGNFRVLTWLIFVLEDFLLLCSGLLSFAILFYLLKSKDWIASLFLFSLAEFMLMIVNDSSYVFSLEFWFSFVVACVCLFFLLFQSKQRFFQMLKQVIPVGLLGGLILWASYDFVSSYDFLNGKSELETVETGVTRGDVAPDFELVSLHGERVKLSELRGKRVILNFWATWCPPCRAEMPDMQKYYAKYGETDNVVVVGVNVTETESHPDRTQGFVDKIGLTFPILLDESSEATNAFEVIVYPTSFFIDEQGVVRFKTVGPMNVEFMRKQVRNME